MIHIQPISERTASPEIQELYHHIKTVLVTESIPLLFQYAANYPEMLAYLWNQIHPHVKTEAFEDATTQVISNSLKCIVSIYQPSESIVGFVAGMNPEEKEEKIQEVSKLLKTQAKMLIIELQIREAIKGMPIIRNQDPKYLSESNTVKQEEESYSLVNSTSLVSASENRFEFDSFFERIEREMNVIVSTKEYLEGRVNFEKNTLFMLLQGAFPLEISYNEFRGILVGKSHIDEFLFLLKDIFPSAAPRQVFTAAMMNYVLNLD